MQIVIILDSPYFRTIYKFIFWICLSLKKNDNLETGLYRKPTDKNTLLHGSGYHPLLLKKCFPTISVMLSLICASVLDQRCR